MFKQVSRVVAFVPVLILAAATQVHAALPTGISTAITAVETDGVTLVGLIAAAGAAVYLIAKVLGRFGLKL